MANIAILNFYFNSIMNVMRCLVLFELKATIFVTANPGLGSRTFQCISSHTSIDVFGGLAGKNFSSVPRHWRYVIVAFAYYFGVSPDATAIAGALPQSRIDERVYTLHLLWILYFLKLYTSKAVNAHKWGCTENTFQQLVWVQLKCISTLPLVSSFSNFIKPQSQLVAQCASL